ncbi:uncharacterized protein LOC121382177 [Gigantopelta aegis]|uniref:uncharacterized protein LOC121382177 n=1 Tax=Gigantopelta aegis TaxID=1735272 RepID=UPI001B888C88|nr:uncharacterized protein LOC121382177 [Gigantopelta aegis]
MRHWTIVFILFFFIKSCVSLKCYVCNSASNGACGETFKFYQFTAEECVIDNAKCGKQIQPPIIDEKGEEWIGVIRACYQPGSLQNLNESNGCHNWTNADNFDATFCFCDTDGCNAGCPLSCGWTCVVRRLLISALILVCMHYVDTG